MAGIGPAKAEAGCMNTRERMLCTLNHKIAMTIVAI